MILIFSLEVLGFSCTRRRLACFPSLVLITALRRIKTNVEEKTCSRPAECVGKKTFKRKGTWISRKASYKHPLLDSIMCLSRLGLCDHAPEAFAPVHSLSLPLRERSHEKQRRLRSRYHTLDSLHATVL